MTDFRARLLRGVDVGFGGAQHREHDEGHRDDDARDPAPGGPGAVPVGGPVTPRLAGATWNAATPFASATMNGVA